jgi:PAT family beta-lactamase induction signal transducer AmpG
MAWRHLFVVFVLGFSSGLPLSLFGATLQTWFRLDGLNWTKVGMLTLVGQPYVYKYLWAPFLDRWSLPYLEKLVGRRRDWIYTMQLLLTAVLFAMAEFSPHSGACWLGLLAVFGACLSATQDIAIDAYRTELLVQAERSLGASLATEGYRLAMLLTSGGALIFADAYGWHWTYRLLALILALAMLFSFWAPRLLAAPAAVQKHSVWHLIHQALRELKRRPCIGWLLAFMICYKLGDAFSLVFNTMFLLELGLSLTVVGSTIKAVGIVSSLLGIFIGGIWTKQLGLWRALVVFGWLQAITNLLYIALLFLPKQVMYSAGVMFLENLVAGLGTAALMTLLMQLCRQPFTATQYAIFSSLTSVGRVYVGPIAAWLLQHLGWHQFYLSTFFISIPGLAIMYYLKPRVCDVWLSQ